MTCELKLEPITVESFKTFKELLDYCDQQIALVILGPNLSAKSFAASRGGPCVALIRPLPRALVKVERPGLWPRGLFRKLYSLWLLRQAQESFFNDQISFTPADAQAGLDDLAHRLRRSAR